jgi:cyclopropane-fatty-acyl-phospholipid synthase
LKPDGRGLDAEGLMTPPTDQATLAAARDVLGHLARVMRLPLAFRLWDGSLVPANSPGEAMATVAVARASVLGRLLRRPSLDTLFRQYVLGGITPLDGDLLGLLDALQRRRKQHRPKLAAVLRGLPWRAVLRLVRTTRASEALDHCFAGEEWAGDEEARDRRTRDDRKLVQFHYDASNDFYRLFLDRRMVYSCAYFRDWSADLDTAQADKLDLICKKLRLRPGERLLDIGCGWGALVCHAAEHYGVTAHGVTLSEAQFDLATRLVAERGLADRVQVELRDYRTVDGHYDKIASIGMYEHVGIDSYPAYFKKIGTLLAEDGVFLNHGITRRAKRERRSFRRPSASRRIILKYIFPGAELDHIGHTLEVMEAAGLEVHDVEGLRRHYARTCRLWYERLVAGQEAAVGHVGLERYRMWLAYLAGVTIGFERGPLRLFQVVATKQRADGKAPLPPTREDLYAGWRQEA